MSKLMDPQKEQSANYARFHDKTCHANNSFDRPPTDPEVAHDDTVSSMCECGTEEETTEHFLLRWNLFDIER